MAEAQPAPLPAADRVIGIDWGVKEIATTTSDGHDRPHPQFGKMSAEKLARYQRRMARRKPKQGQKPSAGYKRAKRVVRDHDVIAVEDFKAKFLAKSTMARRAAGAAIGAPRRALIEMAIKHGRVVHLVDPAHTTMDCSVCGARAKTRLPTLLVLIG